MLSEVRGQAHLNELLLPLDHVVMQAKWSGAGERYNLFEWRYTCFTMCDGQLLSA